MFENVFKAEQTIELPLEKVFDFFARAENLQRITPPLLNFHILTKVPVEMKAGTLIDYKLKIRGVPVKWRTLIEVWDPPHKFVDTQLRGPYQLWHHTHEFTALSPTKTFMRDTIRYRVPLGPLGWIADKLMVRADIQRIFEFRREAILKYLES